jgi:hypothetical protein
MGWKVKYFPLREDAVTPKLIEIHVATSVALSRGVGIPETGVGNDS